MNKHVDTRKTKRNPMESDFTKPEMEAALLLIQLSSDSDHVDVHGHHSSLKSGDDDFHVLIKDLQKKKKMKKGEKLQEQSQQSSGCTNYSNNTNYSEVTSAMSATTVAKIFEEDRDTKEDDEDVACGPRRKIKKFRSLDELYRLTRPL